jgi:hypothetical protein
MIINAKSSKDEIISNGVELIDSQESKIKRLEEQQRILIALLATVFISSVLF